MKNLIFRISFFLMMFIGSSAIPEFAYAQQPDTGSNNISTDQDVEDEEFNLFLLMFALAAICLMAGSFVVGVIIILLALLLFIGLISLGIVSVSVLVGAYKRSFSAGFKVFIMASSGIFCAAIGLLGFAIISESFGLDISR